MHFDTDGIYTLQYTATDSCGNETIEERTVEVISLMTTLFADGTFIVNEKSSDRAANIALHGAVTNEYAPFNPNGVSSNIDKYIFPFESDRPWHSERTQIVHVEMGSPISPISLACWFMNCSALLDADFAGMDTSDVEDFSYFLKGCQVLETIDVSMFNTSNATTMQGMFNDCRKLVPDITNFDTQNVQNMGGMFQRIGNNIATPITLDLSSFDTANVTNVTNIFSNAWNVETILVSSTFVLPNIPTTTSMFYSCDILVGGAGTAYATTSVNKNNAIYAHIDGGTADPGYFTAKA